MNSQKPRIALIGHGYWGKNLARNLSEQGILSAIVDSHYESLDAARKLYPSVPCLSDINEVLADPDIDAVMIATPAITHASLGLAALQADKDVFLEKPLALNIQEGAALVEEAESRGRILMVGHLLEYHPAVREIERQVKNGDLGGLRYIYSNRLNWGRLRREENILWSFAPHDISVVLRLVGSLPKRIQATGGAWIAPDVHDLTVTVLEFSGGVRAHIYVSWLHPHKEQRLVVTGERSVMVFEDSAVEPTRKLRSYAHSVEWLDNAPVAQKAPEESVAFDSVEPLRLECEAFVEAIQTRTPPRTDGRSALRVLQVLEAAQRSLGLGGEWVEIESPTPPIPDVFVHPTAMVDSEVQIGTGSRIWHNSHICSGATIGNNCTFGQNTYVGPGVPIGNRVRIQNNVSVYAGVELADDVFVGPSAVFTNVKNPRSFVNRKDEFGTTIVEKGATIGANATIVCGTTIGSYAFVAAGAVVTRDVRPHQLVAGNPAKPKGWACTCGEILRGETGSKLECNRCGECFVDEDGHLTHLSTT